MEYNIADLEKIDSFDNYGQPTLIIFLKSQHQAIEANYIEFDHKKGTFTTHSYR